MVLVYYWDEKIMLMLMLMLVLMLASLVRTGLYLFSSMLSGFVLYHINSQHEL